MISLPTLLVSRRPRQVGVDWRGARSWFGGAPRLGTTPWPRGRDGLPLHFAAQIDLAEVAAKTGVPAFPSQGSLAFFIGGDGAVIHVPRGHGTDETLPPVDTPELTVSGASPNWPTDVYGRPLYPFWPVDFTRLDVTPPTGDPDDADIDAQFERFHLAEVAAIERHFKRRNGDLSADLAFAGPPIPDWWQTAIFLSGKLQQAAHEAPNVLLRELGMIDYARKMQDEARSKGADDVQKAAATVAMYEKRSAVLRRSLPAFMDFAAEVAAWTEGRDPWAMMSADDKAELVAIASRHKEFPGFTVQYASAPIDQLKDQMFRALPTSGTQGYAVLPQSVRTLIDAKRVPRPHWWYAAFLFARCLRAAGRLGISQASKSVRDLQSYQKKIASGPPGGAFAKLMRTIAGDRTQEVARLETSIAALQAKLDEARTLEIPFQQFASDTTAWAEAHDMWDLMAPADLEQFEARLARAHEEFPIFARYNVPRRAEDLLTATISALATADDRGYATLPEAVRTLINTEYLLPPGAWHQMFGHGASIQGESSMMREESHIMLLQLRYDDLMQWRFGDCGAYQFWILPKDLAKANWGAAKMTFESH